MTTLVVTAAACLAGLLALWACGRLTLGLLCRDESPPAGIVCALGLCGFAFAGGVLNALGMARPPALLLLALAGVVVGVFLLGGDIRRGRIVAPRRTDLLALAPLLAYAALLASTTLPAGLFNFEDDLRIYLVRVLRMLATGSMGGNPFDSLGVDGLGAQSFMQGFVLLFLPESYTQVFDNLFCVVLAGLALDGLGRAWGAGWGLRLAALSLLVVLPTQSINLSAAYSGAALVVALLYSAGRVVERAHEGGRGLPAAFALVCLPAASLAVFKLTFASFAGLYLAGLLVAVPRGARLRAIGTGTLVASVLVLPWAVVVADTHAAGLRWLWESGIEPSAGRLSWGGLASLLAARAELQWGGFAVVYYAALLLTALPVLPLAARGTRGDLRLRPLLLPTALASGALIAAFVLSAWLVEVENAIRYLCPVMVGLLPAALLAVTLAWRREAPSEVAQPRTLPGRARHFTLAAAWLFAALAFADLFVLRMRQAVVHGAPLTYRVHADNVVATRRVFAPATTALVRELQAMTPPGAVLLTWTAVDFHADFARNPVYGVTETGMTLSWVAATATADAATLASALRERGVRYVLLQVDGIGTKSEWWYAQSAAARPGSALERIWGSMARLRAGLFSLADRSRVLAYRPPLLLFEVPPARP